MNPKHSVLSFIAMELVAATEAAQRGMFHESFRNLERAHILAQTSTLQHVRVHCRMFHWAARQRDLREMIGQVFRIIGAATKTVLGLVPAGNTGGANVSAFAAMPVPDDLQRLLSVAR